MKSKCLSLCLLLLMAASGQITPADEPSGDPLREILISPDVLIRHRADIDLTDRQVDRIRSRAQQAGRHIQEIQARGDDAKRRLAKLLTVDKVDEAAALKQLDEVLAIEQQQKRLHLQVMIQIRNELTAKQLQAAARFLQPEARGEPDSGQESRTATTGRRVKVLNHADLRETVAALQKEDVAWRKIQWKTCLLDGLKASREQNKPIMLWIFIDRPIDDERC